MSHTVLLDLCIVRIWAGIAGRMLRIVRNDVLVFGHTATVEAVLLDKRRSIWCAISCNTPPPVIYPQTYRSVAARWALSGRPVGHTVTARWIEAEQLRAHAIVLEARGRAAIAPALGVQREQRAGQRSAQRLVLVRCIVQAAGRVTAAQIRNEWLISDKSWWWTDEDGILEEMMEALDRARRPSEAALRVPQIGHDVAVLPAAFLRTRTAQVAGRRWTIVHGSQSDRVVDGIWSKKKCLYSC